MLKSIFKILKRLIISIIILYSYNIVTNQFNLNIPINIITVLIISVFGFYKWILGYLYAHRRMKSVNIYKKTDYILWQL